MNYLCVTYDLQFMYIYLQYIKILLSLMFSPLKTETRKVFHSCSGAEMKNRAERESYEKTMWPELHI